MAEAGFVGGGPTTDPRPALVGARAGKFGFLIDSIEWRWRAGFSSPFAEHKAGWVEFPDCQRHYINWPNELSDGWEPGGPAYDAWCGGPQYAPPPVTDLREPHRHREGRLPAHHLWAESEGLELPMLTAKAGPPRGPAFVLA